MLQNKASTSCALTFCSAFAIFSHLALQDRLALVGTRKVYNFHAVTVFLSMTSGRLPALLAGYVSGEAVKGAVKDAVRK